MVLALHLSHRGSWSPVECRPRESRDPVSQAPYPDYAPYRISAGSVVWLARFVSVEMPGARGSLARWELAIERSLQQRGARKHYSAS